MMEDQRLNTDAEGMTSLTELVKLIGIAETDVYYTIGAGVIPEQMVKYQQGKVLVNSEVESAMLSAYNIAQSNDEDWLHLFSNIMWVEKRRKKSEHSK